MRVDGWDLSQREQHVDLPWCVVEVIIAADDVRDPHVHIVYDHREIVGWRAVGAGNDEVIELGILNTTPAVDDVIDHDLAAEWILETHHRRNPGGASVRWRQRPS